MPVGIVTAKNALTLSKRLTALKQKININKLIIPAIILTTGIEKKGNKIEENKTALKLFFSLARLLKILVNKCKTVVKTINIGKVKIIIIKVSDKIAKNKSYFFMSSVWIKAEKTNRRQALITKKNRHWVKFRSLSSFEYWLGFKIESWTSLK